jgi:hypothetical protein
VPGLEVIVRKTYEATAIPVSRAIETATIIAAVEDAAVRGSVEPTAAALPIKIIAAPIREPGIVEPVIC